MGLQPLLHGAAASDTPPLPSSQVIKLAFRYYALAGVSNVEDDVDYMTMVQFGEFCGACKLYEEEVVQFDHGRQPIEMSESDRVYLRAAADSRGSASSL